MGHDACHTHKTAMWWLQESIGVTFGCNTFTFVALVNVFSPLLASFALKKTNENQLIKPFCTLNVQVFVCMVTSQRLHRLCSNGLSLHIHSWHAVFIRRDDNYVSLCQIFFVDLAPILLKYAYVVLNKSMSIITEVMNCKCSVSCHTRIV